MEHEIANQGGHLREELLGSSLLLGPTLLDGLLDLGNLVHNSSITRSKLLSLQQVLQSRVLLLQTLVGKSTTVVGLGLVGILGLSSISNLERIGSPVLGLPVFLKLVCEQGRVGVEGETQSLHLRTELLGVFVSRLGELVQVAQALLVLVKTEGEIAALESGVTEALDVGSDLESKRSSELLALVIVGEVLVGVTSDIRNALGRVVEVLTGELTTVHNSHILGGLVVRCLHAFDLADNALAVNDLSENNVLAIEVGCGDGGDEELAAVGAGAGVGHGEQEGTVMLEVEVLVGEFFAVDGLTTGTVERSEVTTLDHELLDHPVEN